MTRQVRVLRTLACGGRGKEAWEEAKRKVVDAGGRVEEARGRRGCGGHAHRRRRSESTLPRVPAAGS